MHHNHYEDTHGNTRCIKCLSKVEGGYCHCYIERMKRNKGAETLGLGCTDDRNHGDIRGMDTPKS